MPQSGKPGNPVKKLLLGFTMTCPNCEQFRFSKGWFQIKPQCDVCGVRYERAPGEGTGAMILTLSLTPIISIVLFFVMWALEVPIWTNAIISVGSVIVLSLLFYRHAKGLWVAVTYLSGGLYADD